ncbi:hypothetical protein HYT45_01045 [Candidatus Uhrbacteria bacterium]|nr:hypothetical protein [Candidatus Uhrbacteria bacterium]
MSVEISPEYQKEIAQYEKKKRKKGAAGEASDRALKGPSEAETEVRDILKMERERVAAEQTKKEADERAKEARFKKGLEKLKATEAKRREEEKLIEEARAELAARYKEREPREAETAVAEVLKMTAEKAAEETAKPKEAPAPTEAEAAMAEALEMTKERAMEEEDKEALYRKEIAEDLKILQGIAEISKAEADAAVNEDLQARAFAEKILSDEQLDELDRDPVERAFFISGEIPLLLARREAAQESVDMEKRASDAKIGFSDWLETVNDLRSAEEGGKQIPMKTETEQERTQALFKFETALRKNRLEAIDEAHKEFPELFPFTGKDFEDKRKQTSLLEETVEKEKKKAGWGGKLKRLFGGVSIPELELRKARQELDEMQKKIADYVDAGKSKLAAKIRLSHKGDIKRLEEQASKFMTR